MAACPRCGYGNDEVGDFCANPDCRADLRPLPGGGAQATASPIPARAPVRVTSPYAVRSPVTAANQAPAAPGGPPSYPPAPRGTAAPTPAVDPDEAQRRGVRITAEHTELNVEPGAAAVTTVTVRNVGTQVERFRLATVGPAAPFAQVEPAQLSVFPDAEETAVVRFAPPRGPRPGAGPAPFQVSARSEVHHDVSDRVAGVVTVGRFDELHATLEPETTRGRRPGRHQLTVTNAGNAVLAVQVALTDRDGELTYDPPRFGAPVPAGSSVQQEVTVVGPVPWFGRTQSHSFAATVTSDGAPPPVLLSGVRRQLPRFPWWVPTAALALVGILIAIYALLPADTVPTVAGQVREAAVATLANAGYRAVEIAQPNDEVAAGTAIRTEPRGGAELPDGERVRLFVSAGPCDDACPVTVPNVDGLPVEEATRHLAAAQFVVARVNEQQNPAVPAGTVISTAPPGGAEAEPGSEIVITASAGSAPTAQPTEPGSPGDELMVPDVVGKPAGDAVREIEALGLVAAEERIRSNEAPRDEVLRTEPAAEETVAAGDTVTLTVAEPTAPIDLLAAARNAEWSDGDGELRFGSEPAGRGSAIRLDAAVLEDRSIATVLHTRPPADGSVTGEFTLPEPIIPGDHLRASVGLIGTAPGEAVFVVRAGGEELARLSATADGELDALDVDLSPAAGASAVEITVRAGDRAAWKDLRIEGQVG